MGSCSTDDVCYELWWYAAPQQVSFYTWVGGLPSCRYTFKCPVVGAPLVEPDPFVQPWSVFYLWSLIHVWNVGRFVNDCITMCSQMDSSFHSVQWHHRRTKPKLS